MLKASTAVIVNSTLRLSQTKPFSNSEIISYNKDALYVCNHRAFFIFFYTYMPLVSDKYSFKLCFATRHHAVLLF